MFVQAIAVWRGWVEEGPIRVCATLPPGEESPGIGEQAAVPRGSAID